MTSSPRTKAAARLAAQREPCDKKGTKYINRHEHIQIKMDFPIEMMDCQFSGFHISVPSSQK